MMEFLISKTSFGPVCRMMKSEKLSNGHSATGQRMVLKPKRVESWLPHLSQCQPSEVNLKTISIDWINCLTYKAYDVYQLPLTISSPNFAFRNKLLGYYSWLR